MPFNRAWLVLPSKRVEKQKNKNFKSIKFIYIKSRFNTTLSNKKKKSVLNKSECFCENTSELQFAHQLNDINIKTKELHNNTHF